MADLDHVAGLDAQLAGGGRREQDGVVPGHLGDRVRAAPAARRCWRSGRRRPWGRRRRRPPARRPGAAPRWQGASRPASAGAVERRRRLGLAARLLDHAVGQPGLPGALEALGGGPPLGDRPALPELLEQGVRALVALAEEAGQQVGLGAAVPQRVDERLDQRHGAVERLDVAPGLEHVGLGDEGLGHAPPSRPRSRP